MFTDLTTKEQRLGSKINIVKMVLSVSLFTLALFASSQYLTYKAINERSEQQLTISNTILQNVRHK